MNASKNKKAIYIVIACLIVVFAILGGIHYHKTHVLDGQWVVKTVAGETPNTEKPITLTISGNKHFKIDNDGIKTSGDIIRDDKNNKLQFIMKKQRSYTRNQTDTASFELSDDKKELTIDFPTSIDNDFIYSYVFPDNPIVLEKK